MDQNTFVTIPKEKQTRTNCSPAGGGLLATAIPYNTSSPVSPNGDRGPMFKTDFMILHGTGLAKSGIKLPVRSVNRLWD